MSKYLVTGGAGFIGANFVKYMLSRYRDIQLIILDKLTYAGNMATIEQELKDERVVLIQGDICDRVLVDRVFSEQQIQYVINFAAESHVDHSISNPQLFLQTNVLGTQVLLESAKTAWRIGTDRNGYPTYEQNVKYLQISTDEVYGSLTKDYAEPQKLKLQLEQLTYQRSQAKTFGEALFTEQTPLSPRSPYSASKASADMIVLAYHDTYKLPVNITRCSNNYGPYHYPEKLIPLMIQHVLQGKQLPVYGKGDNVRDWLYVGDHVKAVDLVLHKGRTGEVYNVGGYNEEENIEIVKLIIRTIRSMMINEPRYQPLLASDVSQLDERMITYVQDRLGHDKRYAINPAKIVKELGWYPETSFEQGMEMTIRWYLDNQDWVKAVLKK